MIERRVKAFADWTDAEATKAESSFAVDCDSEGGGLSLRNAEAGAFWGGCEHERAAVLAEVLEKTEELFPTIENAFDGGYAEALKDVRRALNLLSAPSAEGASS